MLLLRTKNKILFTQARPADDLDVVLRAVQRQLKYFMYPSGWFDCQFDKYLAAVGTVHNLTHAAHCSSMALWNNISLNLLLEPRTSRTCVSGT
jgi:hypothetical protein